MNAGLTLATILSLLLLALAAAGDTTSQRAGAPSPAEVYGVNLNHNETLVSDAQPAEEADALSLWLSGAEEFSATLFTQFSVYRTGLICSPMVCGTNHNETLVRDTAPME